MGARAFHLLAKPTGAICNLDCSYCFFLSKEALDFFRQALPPVEHYREPGQQVQHTIQTNATLLDDDWADLFAEHEFLVGGHDACEAMAGEVRIG